MPTEQEIAAFRDGWRYRAIVATGGRSTEFGTILLAILGSARGLPQYGPSAVIDAQGVLWCTWFKDRDGVQTETPVPICLTPDFTAWMTRLADAIKATDAERQEMFAEARKWVIRDGRALAADEPSALGNLQLGQTVTR